MDEFQTINNIVDSAIKNSSYISVLISSGVFIIYTITNKLIDLFKSKDRNKPLLEMATAIKDVSSNVVKLNNVLDKTFRDAERKEIAKCKNAIILAFSNFCNVLTRETTDMVITNHIEENKELISENIAKLVTAEYYKVHSSLAMYEINGINVSTKLEKEWIQETVISIISIMYNGQDTVTRISQLSNRLNLIVNNYSTYTCNKSFNS